MNHADDDYSIRGNVEFGNYGVWSLRTQGRCRGVETCTVGFLGGHFLLDVSFKMHSITDRWTDRQTDGQTTFMPIR